MQFSRFMQQQFQCLQQKVVALQCDQLGFRNDTIGRAIGEGSTDPSHQMQPGWCRCRSQRKASANRNEQKENSPA